MAHQSLFSVKSEKRFEMLSAEILPRILSVNYISIFIHSRDLINTDKLTQFSWASLYRFSLIFSMCFYHCETK